MNAKDDRISIHSNIDSHLHKVSASHIVLSEALLNIMSNGVDAMADVKGGTLSVRAQNVADDSFYGVKIHIEDTGHGIHEDDFENIFTPSFSTKKGANRGYGLWESQSCNRRYGGTYYA